MTDTPIYRQVSDALLLDPAAGAGSAPAPGEQPATTMLPIRYGDATDWPGPDPDPPSRTAGEQDHADPWAYAGPDADAPVNP